MKIKTMYKHFRFQNGETYTFEYVVGDQKMVELLSDRNVQEKYFPEMREEFRNGEVVNVFINPLVEVSETKSPKPQKRKTDPLVGIEPIARW